jgi:hypothetical protein
MMVYWKSQSRIHKIHKIHGEHDNHELVPENLQGEHNNIILLAIYNVHNAIYRSTEYTQLLFISFACFSLNPLDLLAMKTRQINAPI